MKKTRMITKLQYCCVVIAMSVLAASCSKSKPSFAEAESAAGQVIESRTSWPESPEALCKAFWAARAHKDYRELEILWPGSASSDWKKICANDADVKYVFGTVKDHTVPYASEEYYRTHGSYNLTMRLGSRQSPWGRRYYVISAN